MGKAFADGRKTRLAERTRESRFDATCGGGGCSRVGKVFHTWTVPSAEADNKVPSAYEIQSYVKLYNS